jgi:hypothetical protein
MKISITNDYKNRNSPNRSPIRLGRSHDPILRTHPSHGTETSKNQLKIS